uniref:Ig-like domain-containing protein n=1 Tax=Vombatus ursinus TaxID=29139 RepID=A0A4X2LGD3_VOMUR
MLHSCLVTTMDTMLFWCVAICLLGVGFSDVEVIQVPKQLITETRRTVTLTCDPISGHVSLYWYRQMKGERIELLVYFQNNRLVDDTGLPKDRFFIDWPEKSSSTVKIQTTEFKDSAVYLCASSPTTALHSHLLSVHKSTFFSLHALSLALGR